MSKSNRGSTYEEEIEVKPSTELIPDEYEHFGNQPKFSVHTFFHDTEADENNENEFLTTLRGIGITCENGDRHNLDKEKIFEIIKRIKENCSDDTAGLIMYFSGDVKLRGGILHTKVLENNTSIQKIWLEFNSFNCFQLKNKPKIFIFDLKVYEPPIQQDAKRISVKSLPISVYDTPSEADILVICNKDIDDDSEFTYHFCNNIKSHGDKENIITLASCVGSLTSPIIISTLTRHFYFTPSELRGHHLVIRKHQQQLKEHVEEIHNIMAKKTKLVESKKKLGIFGSIREKFRKSDDNKSASPSTSAAVTDAAESGNNRTPSTQPTRPSGPSSIRSRKMSQSEPEGARSSTKKPPWR
ncbi:uncharacterized protein [Diabrotica undecimpunctata]|uniref:uncharacterized protein n=1 Tax=Diabrotica undecimpunctata TaxID=50387 RepID=UPI003B63B113